MKTAKRARSSSYLGNNSHVNIILFLNFADHHRMLNFSSFFGKRCSVSVSSVSVLLRFDKYYESHLLT
jgi:hypothetical protein